MPMTPFDPHFFSRNLVAALAAAIALALASPSRAADDTDAPKDGGKAQR